MKKLVLAVLLAMSMALVGCGDDDDKKGSSGGGGGGVTAPDFSATYDLVDISLVDGDGNELYQAASCLTNPTLVITAGSTEYQIKFAAMTGCDTTKFAGSTIVGFGGFSGPNVTISANTTVTLDVPAEGPNMYIDVTPESLEIVETLASGNRVYLGGDAQ
jgi:hypothetical protein